MFERTVARKLFARNLNHSTGLKIKEKALFNILSQYSGAVAFKRRIFCSLFTYTVCFMILTNDKKSWKSIGDEKHPDIFQTEMGFYL